MMLGYSQIIDEELMLAKLKASGSSPTPGPSPGGSAEDAIIARTISGVYTNSTVTQIGGNAFVGCTALTTASFPAVTTIGHNAFLACTALTTASFPVATSIGPNAFNGCTALTTAYFPTVTSIGRYAFQSCTALTTASFPVVSSIGEYAFQSCTALTTASFPVVSSIGESAFLGCSELMSLYLLGSSVPSLSSSAFIATPILVSTASGQYGSVFVRASLVSAFQSAQRWSSMTSRIVGLTDQEIEAL